jgi:hypothetical protein
MTTNLLMVKGLLNKKAEYKMTEFSKTHNLEILFWTDLKKLCNLTWKSIDSYFTNARFIGLSPEDYLAKGLYQNAIKRKGAA